MMCAKRDGDKADEFLHFAPAKTRARNLGYVRRLIVSVIVRGASDASVAQMPPTTSTHFPDRSKRSQSQWKYRR